MKTDSFRPIRSMAARSGGLVVVVLWRACLACLVCLGGAACLGCNPERKAECDQFVAAMKPLGQGAPTVADVDRVQSAVAAIRFQDQTLGVYAKNYAGTLTVLSNTLKLKAGESPPDGTDDVIKTNLKQARTDADDTARYCAQ